jgi:hypothetical protein
MRPLPASMEHIIGSQLMIGSLIFAFIAGLMYTSRMSSATQRMLQVHHLA